MITVRKAHLLDILLAALEAICAAVPSPLSILAVTKRGALATGATALTPASHCLSATAARRRTGARGGPRGGAGSGTGGRAGSRWRGRATICPSRAIIARHGLITSHHSEVPAKKT